MDYRTFRIRKRIIIEGKGRRGRKMCQLDPCVSFVNGYKIGNILGENQSAGVGSC